MRGKRSHSVDPLFQLFEHHLVTRSYEDSSAFTKEVAEGYLAYLDSTQVHVPLHVRQSIMEDLEAETHELLVKKMYGVVKANDYINFGRVIKVAKNELSTFEFQPKPSSISTESNEEK